MISPVKHLETSGSSTDANSYNTGSITPDKGLTVVGVYAIRAAGSAAPTLSGNGLTYTQHSTIPDGTGARRLTLFRAVGSGTAGAITISFSGVTQLCCLWTIFQIFPVDLSGSNGGNAFVQAVTQTNNSVTSQTINLSAFGNVNNATFGVFAKDGSNVASVGSGFTQIGQHQESTPASAILSQYRTDNDTSVDWSLGGGGDVANGIALEIKAGQEFQGGMI